MSGPHNFLQNMTEGHSAKMKEMYVTVKHSEYSVLVSPSCVCIPAEYSETCTKVVSLFFWHAPPGHSEASDGYLADLTDMIKLTSSTSISNVCTI